MTFRYRSSGGPFSGGRYDAYVDRQADTDLFNFLHSDTLCYVCNARQMGKTSLWNRTKDRLLEDAKGKKESYHFALVDFTLLSCDSETDEREWYYSFIYSLNSQLQILDENTLDKHFSNSKNFTPVAALSNFLSAITARKNQKIIIGIDEIDRLLDTSFEASNFFNLIGNSHGLRSHHLEQSHLGFVLMGVASPSDLGDRTFNKAAAIDLTGISADNALPVLSNGLRELVSSPRAIIEHILEWTGGQPFLTQKACGIIQDAAQETEAIQFSIDELISWSGQLIKENIIDTAWSKDLNVHFRPIRDAIVENNHQAGRLLDLYESILTGKPTKDERDECIRLCLSGLVFSNNNFLYLRSLIYREVFTEEWIEKRRTKIRERSGYLSAFIAWKDNDKDETYLLTGQRLADIEENIDIEIGGLPEEDQEFIRQSQRYARNTAADREKEARKRFYTIRKFTVGTGFVAALFSVLAVWQASRAKIANGVAVARQHEVDKLKEEEEDLNQTISTLNVQIDDLKADVTFAEAQRSEIEDELSLVNKDLQETTTNLEGTQKRLRTTEENLSVASKDLEIAQIETLEAERDAQSARSAEFLAIRGQQTALTVTSLNDRSTQVIDRFQNDQLGALAEATELLLELKELDANQEEFDITKLPTVEPIRAFYKIFSNIKEFNRFSLGIDSKDFPKVAFSPNEKYLILKQLDAENREYSSVQLRDLSGRMIHSFRDGIFDISVHPFLPIMLTTSNDGIAKLWQGKNDNTISFLKEIQTNNSNIVLARFSPDGRFILTISQEGRPILHAIDGNTVQTLSINIAQISDDDNQFFFSFSNDGQYLATGSLDGVIRLFHLHNHSEKEFDRIGSAALDINFSPDGKSLVTASSDGKTRVWDLHGQVLHELNGDQGPLYTANFTPDGEAIYAAPFTDNLLWKIAKIQTKVNISVALSNSSRFRQNISVWNREGIKLEGPIFFNRVDDHPIAFMPIFNGHGNALVEASGGLNLILESFVTRGINAFSDQSLSLSVDELINSGFNVLSDLPHASANSADFTSNGKVFASISPSYISLWNSSGVEGVDLKENVLEDNQDVFSFFSFNTPGDIYVGYFSDGKLSSQSSQTSTNNFTDLVEKVDIFNPSGRVVERFSGAALDYLKSDSNAYFLPNDIGINIFNPANGSIQIISSSGEIIREFANDFSDSDSFFKGIIGGDDDFLDSIENYTKFAAFNNDDIYIYDLEGNLTRQFVVSQSSAFNDYDLLLYTNEARILNADIDYLVIPGSETYIGDGSSSVSFEDSHEFSTMRIFDTTGSVVQTIRTGIDPYNDFIDEFTISPDGTFLFVGSSDGVGEVWNISDNKLHAKINTNFPIVDASFSPDSNFLIIESDTSVSIDDVGPYQIWTNSGMLLAEFNSDIQFTPDAKHIMVLPYNGLLKYFPLNDIDQLILDSCQYLKSYFYAWPYASQELIEMCADISERSNLPQERANVYVPFVANVANKPLSAVDSDFGNLHTKQSNRTIQNSKGKIHSTEPVMDILAPRFSVNSSKALLQQTDDLPLSNPQRNTATVPHIHHKPRSIFQQTSAMPGITGTC